MVQEHDGCSKCPSGVEGDQVRGRVPAWEQMLPATTGALWVLLVMLRLINPPPPPPPSITTEDQERIV